MKTYEPNVAIFHKGDVNKFYGGIFKGMFAFIVHHMKDDFSKSYKIVPINYIMDGGKHYNFENLNDLDEYLHFFNRNREIYEFDSVEEMFSFFIKHKKD